MKPHPSSRHTQVSHHADHDADARRHGRATRTHMSRLSSRLPPAYSCMYESLQVRTDSIQPPLLSPQLVRLLRTCQHCSRDTGIRARLAKGDARLRQPVDPLTHAIRVGDLVALTAPAPRAPVRGGYLIADHQSLVPSHLPPCPSCTCPPHASPASPLRARAGPLASQAAARAPPGLQERMKGPRYDVFGPWPMRPAYIADRL